MSVGLLDALGEGVGVTVGEGFKDFEIDGDGVGEGVRDGEGVGVTEGVACGVNEGVADGVTEGVDEGEGGTKLSTII